MFGDSMRVKFGAIVVAAFVSGAFVASPELRAYAANTIGSSDIIDNSIQSVDIKDGEVKNVDIASSAVTKSKLAGNSVDGGKVTDQSLSAADLGPDSVGASELKGVSKLIFAECQFASSFPLLLGAGTSVTQPCNVPGTDEDDRAFASVSISNTCFGVTGVLPYADTVAVSIRNHCSSTQSIQTVPISVMVYDK